MKSFFQRFHDSQLGASKSRTKDAAYKQWIPSSKPDKDRSQYPNGAESDANPSSKRLAPKVAGLRPGDGPSPEALGRVTTDYSNRFSTIPGSSARRQVPPTLPPPLPLPQSRPLEPSPSKAFSPKSLDDVKEKVKMSSKRNEATDLSVTEQDAVPRTKSERPSRSRQTSAPPTSQSHQIWRPSEAEKGSNEKGKRKERQKQVDDTDDAEARQTRENGHPDRRDRRAREYGHDQEPGVDNRLRAEAKEKERRERRREQPQEKTTKDEQWEQQTRDMYQLREARERERVKERREKDRYRERTKEREREKVDDQIEQGERDMERDKEKTDRDRKAQEKVHREAARLQFLQEQAQKEVKEQQEKERRAKELRERERRERKAREARELQAERDRREQIEMQRKERERHEAQQRERERLQHQQEKEREQQDRERTQFEKERQKQQERERHQQQERERQQQDRERQQQEKWEREQDERERKELDRLERDRRKEERRRKEQELRQRESDQGEVDLLRIERDRQEQRKREREQWEQQREREREERERRWRGDKNPEGILTDTGANDKSSIRSRRRGRRDGVSDSEKETVKTQDSDKRRMSRLVAQTNTPPKTEDRPIPIAELTRSVEDLTKSQSLKHPELNGVTDPSSRRTDSRQVLREDGYASENAIGQTFRDPSGRGVDSSRLRLPSIPEIRSPPLTQKQLPLDPPMHLNSPPSTEAVERMVSIAPSIHSIRQDLGNVRTIGHVSTGQVHPVTEETLQNPRKRRSPSALDAQLPAQPSVTTVLNIPEAAHRSTQSAPLFAEPKSSNVPSVPFNSTALTEVKANEFPQDIRILPPPLATQISHSHSSTPPSRVLINPQDTISSKDTRPSGQNGYLAPSNEGQPSFPKTMSQKFFSNKETSTYSPPNLLTPSSNHPSNKIALPGHTYHRPSEPTASEAIRSTESTQTPSISRPSQYGHSTYQNPVTSDLIPPREAPGKDQPYVLKHVGRDSLPQDLRRKEDSAPQLSRTQAPYPAAPATIDSRHATTKHPPVPPDQDEIHQELPQPPADPKLTSTTRPSPQITSFKAQDESLLQPALIMAHSSKQDLKARTSPYASKPLLHESTPPTSRQHLSDKSNHQDNRVYVPVQPPATTPPSEPRNVSHDTKHHEYDLTRVAALPPPDSHDSPSARHHRHHSETEVSRRMPNPSPRSQPMESPHSIEPQLTGPRGSKAKPSPKINEAGELDSGQANIAFRTPVMEDIPSSDKKRHLAATEPGRTAITQAAVDQSQSHKRKQTSQGISTLVTHYEQLEEAARIGGSIVRPGTTVPRSSTARHMIPETPSLQARAGVYPVAYSQSSTVPQIDRPSTAIGIRPSVSSASQSQSRNVPISSSKQERISKFELLSFPEKTMQHAATLLPVTNETRNEYTPPQASHSSATRVLHSIPEARPAPVPPVPSERVTNHRPPPGASVLSHRVFNSDGAITTEMPARSAVKSTVTENNRMSRTDPQPEHATVLERSHPQVLAEGKEEQLLMRQYTGNRGDAYPAQAQSIHPVNTSHSDFTVRKDNTGGSIRESAMIYSSQPRTRKESSPRVRPNDDQPRLSNSRDGDVEDSKAQYSRSGQARGETRGSVPLTEARYLSQRAEPTRADSHYTTGPQSHGYTSDVSQQQTLAYFKHSSADEKTRSRHHSSNHPSTTSQRTPPSNPTSVSPQRTGNSVHSNLEDEVAAHRNQKHSVPIKDARLAELLSPPKFNDLSHHPYLQDARKDLVSKLDQQHSGSPSTAQALSSNEVGSRPRGSSGRGEHSPRFVAGGDSSPSGVTHTPPHSQQQDSSSRENGFLRSSPNVSHHTPSPRTRTVAVENPALQPRDEGPRPPIAQPHKQPPVRERRPEAVTDTEDMPTRKAYAPHMTHDTDSKIEETNRPSYIPSHQIWDPQSGRPTSHKDAGRKHAYDNAQSVTLTHSRTRSDPQNKPETSTSHSRYTYNDSYNTATVQAQPSPHSPALIHAASSSAPTLPSLGQLSDHMQHAHSYPSSHQIPAAREEAPIPQAPPMKSTSSKRDLITPLPHETRSANTSINPQPPTPKSYEIWLPPTSSQNDQAPSRSTPTPSSRRESGRERRTSTVPRVRSPSPRRSQYQAYHPPIMDPQLGFPNPYHYIKTRKTRTMSMASLEAQDGAASTVIGSPTASILSQAPFNLPPEQDPILYAREWSEAAATRPGQRIRRPGLVWNLPEDPPPIQQQEPRRPEPRSSRSRRPRSSSSRSREASDTDQPSS